MHHGRQGAGEERKERRGTPKQETRSPLNSKTIVIATQTTGRKEVQKGTSYSKKVRLSYVKCQ